MIDDPAFAASDDVLEPVSPPFSTGWRRLALLGGAVSLASATFASGPPFRPTGTVVFSVVAVAALLCGWLLFAPARRRFLARPDLLVPVGVVLLIQQLIDWLSRLPGLSAILTPSASGGLLGISLSFSLLWLLKLAVWPAFVAWQTDLLIQDVNDPAAELENPWVAIARGFWPSFAALGLGVGVIVVATAACLGLMAVAMPVGLVAMSALGIGWNLATAALVPTVLMHQGSIVSRLRAGIRQSFRKGGWEFRLFVQIFLMGLVTYFSATNTTQSGQGGISTVNTSYHWSVNVNPTWLGGYESQGHLYSDAVKFDQGEPFPLFTWILGVEFLVLTVGLKWLIIGRLVAKPKALEAADPAG
jgi:hypothetical protein